MKHQQDMEGHGPEYENDDVGSETTTKNTAEKNITLVM